eukprot:COSAG02_NODE_23468_length_717_cov_4.702265_2_plen_33_part_01
MSLSARRECEEYDNRKIVPGAGPFDLPVTVLAL